MKISTTFLGLFLATGLNAGPRTSANYTAATDTADSAGRRTTSASYTSDSSLGGGVGISTVAAPAETAKHGYVGQLTEVAALQLAASPATVNETGTRQLSASQLLDDLTTLAVPPGSISWSILSGPLSSISAAGLATAGAVYQDTSANVQGAYQGRTAALGLTVLNTLPDNFGSYAADGLADAWQVQHFGLANPQAGPALDPDFDGLTNFMEHAFGLTPTSGASLQLPPAQKTGSNLVISFATPPGVSGITYGAEWSTTLMPGSWAPIPDTGIEPQHVFSVPIAGNARMFMRLKVAGP